MRLRDLSSRPGFKPRLQAVEGWRPSSWTTREGPIRRSFSEWVALLFSAGRGVHGRRYVSPGWGSVSSALLSPQTPRRRWAAAWGERPAHLPLQWHCVPGGLWARGTAQGASARPPTTAPALLAPEDAGLGLGTSSRGPGDCLQRLTRVVERGRSWGREGREGDLSRYLGKLSLRGLWGSPQGAQ